ncbi:pilus assembly protein [Mesorhizobium sp. KR1-2]|uniref:TadE/TadG family type IV pilus assembly protein n=1 Tax=Mesorhizobium sp. KR1-2 TaxID=3156609 RepID=UPI0032B311FB
MLHTGLSKAPALRSAPSWDRQIAGVYTVLRRESKAKHPSNWCTDANVPLTKFHETAEEGSRINAIFTLFARQQFLQSGIAGVTMLINRFWRSQSGNFAMMFALSLPAVFAGVGLALDISNLMTAKSNLQNALDSAVLAASRLADASTSRTDVFNGFFKANISGKRELLNASAELKVDQAINSIRTSATATADVALNFGFIFGQSAHISVTSSAYESTAKLEIALVLDNTGSMGDSNMKALRDGATNLINILQEAKKQNFQRTIRSALVPFVTAVNIKGDDFFKQEWIDKRLEIPANETNTFNGVNFEPLTNKNRVGHWELFRRLNPKNIYVADPVSTAISNPSVDWKGCVEARPSPYNLDDAKPNLSNPATLFVPYFAPDEPGVPAKAQNADGSVFNNSYLADVSTSKDNATLQKYIGKYVDVSTKQSTQKTPTDYLITAAAPLTSGPNYACPTPIAPLTDDLEKLKTEISKMTYWNGSGTNVSEGLAWGYRVLSPNFGTGDAFNSEGTSKVVVVFTDGENNVFGQKDNINKSDYGSYGYLSNGRLDSTQNRSKALTNVNNMTQSMCTKLKAQGVRVFTVVFGADTTANRDLYGKCATTPDNFYVAKTQDQLKAAFQTIAFSISQLYITN